MRILQLCKKFPFPLNDGESIAVTNLSRSLASLGCEISLLAMNTSKDFVNIEKFEEEINHYKYVDYTNINNDITPLGAFKNLFSRSSYHIARFISEEYKFKLIDLLEKNEYDVIQLETVYLAPYIDLLKEHSNALIVMRAHNVEHEIWERIAQNTKFLPKKIYIEYLTRKLRSEEISFLQDYDYLLAISERDLKRYRDLGYKNSATTIPIGIETKEYKSIKKNVSVKTDHIRPSFIGSLDWAPNIEGLQWFLDDIWPSLVADYPDLKFHIAGKNAIKEKEYYRNGIVYHGEVSSAIDFLRKTNVLIVPLLSGSGMRAKILEGMALGMTVITTTLGLEGIPAENKKHVLIADTLKDFKDIIAMLYDDPEQIYVIGARARTFILERYDSIIVAHKLLEVYKNYLTKIDFKNSDSKVAI